MKKMKKFICFIASTLLLSSCSISSNVKSEWDCQAPSGEGCIDIQRADFIAISKLAETTENSQTAQSVQKINQEEKTEM